MTRPVLVLCAHGTANIAGQQTIARLRELVAQGRPELRVELAYVDVQEPKVGDVVARAAADGGSVVVVPVLLASGYHVQVDIASAVAPFPNARSAAPLGPDETLVDILVDRLAAAGVRDGDAIVLAAAGSSRAEAREAPQEVARDLGGRLSRPVTIGYGASAAPTVPEAVRAAAVGGRRVVVAAYLLAPGHFHDRLRASGADVVTEPIGADPRLVPLISRRYRGAR